MTPELTKKIKLATKTAGSLKKRLSSCAICPRNCKINRLRGEKGYCGTDKDMMVYSAFAHHGEEPEISGQGGSGTIFFSGCNLKCIYCQNYKFSHIVAGKKVSGIDLAKIMLDLQEKGAHNINLVTPTHFLPQILDTLSLAFKGGLNIPIVYNTSGYEKKEIIKCLEGIVDIYLTDLKYMDSSLAKQYSKAPEYPVFASRSLLEMARQVAVSLTSEGLLKKGVVIRHLVLPNYIDESKKLLSWIKKNTPKVLVSVMFQYQPYFKAHLHSQINRPINYREYIEIKNFVEELGLKGWVQDLNTKEGLAGPYFKPNI
ncbi:MAG: radical SAM protein [Candidatus Omnitrophica bacterium]|nr:radical SAM protein [Candidatus Omnitrophota bacterium]